MNAPMLFYVALLFYVGDHEETRSFLSELVDFLERCDPVVKA